MKHKILKWVNNTNNANGIAEILYALQKENKRKKEK